MKSFLLEIQTEELPAGYILPAADALCSRLLEKLDAFRIGHGRAKTYATPRRLAVVVQGVASRQEPFSREIMGPPERVAFDKDGKPTIAAVKFAEKNDVSVKSLMVRETEKGRYVFAEKKEPANASGAVLKKILPDLILSLPFPKSMRWGKRSIRFARPIHGIVALFGKQVVSFEIEGIRSGRKTVGHRFMHKKKISLASSEDYAETIASAFVIPDFNTRKRVMMERMEALVNPTGGVIVADDELCDTVANLVEYPEPVMGRFDDAFLSLPEEILITSMREHQKYFAVRDPSGALLPCFLAVNNTRAADMSVVTHGHERVLRARLEDARFFYETDMKTRLADRVEGLKKVLFQAKLGSLYDKVVRVEAICRILCGMLGIQGALADDILRAAHLCKADLVTNVVVEFPRLQGVMGRVYAAMDGEGENVAVAIGEHYLPTSSGGALPQTLSGAVLSIADKMDTLCGCFRAGLIPSGGADPYALRRQGIGIIRIALEKDFSFSLSLLISKSLGLFSEDDSVQTDEVSVMLHDFLKSRMENLLEGEGVSKDLAAAVLSASADNIPDVWKRAHALSKLKSEPGFEPIAAAFKRVVNIIRKADPADIDARLDPECFSDKSEKALYARLSDVRTQVAEFVDAGDMDSAFASIAAIRPAVDEFFDAVLVMDEDARKRKNRLALLREVAEIFSGLADFSRIST